MDCLQCGKADVNDPTRFTPRRPPIAQQLVAAQHVQDVEHRRRNRASCQSRTQGLRNAAEFQTPSFGKRFDFCLDRRRGPVAAGNTRQNFPDAGRGEAPKRSEGGVRD